MLHMCFVDQHKTFDRVPRNVLEWAMMTNGIQAVLVRSVISLYEGAKTRIILDFELSEELEVKVWMQQGSVLSPFLFAVVADVVIEFARDGALSELVNADDLILMSETIEGLSNKCLRAEEGF